MSDIPPPFDAIWFRALVGFIVGMALGSFGTMLWYRVPRQLSIISPGSHCPQCKTPLRAADLVPLFSWLWTRGKCRHCGMPIGSQYLIIELIIASVCALIVALIPMIGR